LQRFVMLAVGGRERNEKVARTCKFMAVSFMSNKNKNSIPVRILPPHNFKLIKYLRVEGERLQDFKSGMRTKRPR
jgi:hypothetical protein